jgi:hypothetical protein
VPSTIPITVTPEEQATLLARAEAQGVTVDVLLRRAVLHMIYPSEGTPTPQQLRGKDLESAFEEPADLVPDFVPPPSTETCLPVTGPTAMMF